MMSRHQVDDRGLSGSTTEEVGAIVVERDALSLRWCLDSRGYVVKLTLSREQRRVVTIVGPNKERTYQRKAVQHRGDGVDFGA